MSREDRASGRLVALPDICFLARFHFSDLCVNRELARFHRTDTLLHRIPVHEPRPWPRDNRGRHVHWLPNRPARRRIELDKQSALGEGFDLSSRMRLN